MPFYAADRACDAAQDPGAAGVERRHGARQLGDSRVCSLVAGRG